MFLFSEKKAVFFYLFIALPLFDMLTGYSIYNGYIEEGSLGSPSRLGRLLALCLLVFVILRHRLRFSWLLLLFPLLIVELSAGIFLQNWLGVAVGIVTLSKLFYLSTLCIVLSHYIKSDVDMDLFAKYLSANLILIASSIYISMIAGIGNSTYGWGFGTKGFFASGNGLGIYLGVSCLLLIALRKLTIFNGFGLASSFFVMVSIILIGTKTSLIFFLLISIYLLINSKYKYLLLPVLLVLFIFSHEILREIANTLFDVILSRLENTSSVAEYLASSRALFVHDAISTFSMQDSSFFRLPFGSGSFLSFQDPSHVVKFDTLETDMFDLLFMYGFLGLILYLGFILRTSFLLRKHFSLLCIFFVLFLHSALMGHVLWNGMSSTVMAILFAVATFITSRENSNNV